MTFVGLRFFRPHVMVEYDVEPPIPQGGFGPRVLVIEATDDGSAERYPTSWQDFPWPWEPWGVNRATTRLERCPDPEARRLTIAVRPAERPDERGRPRWDSSLPVALAFDVPLPSGHGLPFNPDEPTPVRVPVEVTVWRRGSHFFRESR